MRVRSVLAVAMTVLALASCGSDDAAHAPTLADPAATGALLATEFLTILQGGDVDELDAYLADGFQLQRSDGTGATKVEYLTKPATVNDFMLGSEVVAVQQGDVLTVRWSVTVDEVVNGQVAGKEEAPRLSTFVWVDGRWRLLSHANFNPIRP